MTSQYNKVRNERRKAQRRISRLEASFKKATTASEKRQISKSIQNYQNIVESTYTYSPKTGKRIRNANEVSENLKTLKVQNQAAGVFFKEAPRSDLLTKIEINKASSRETESASEYTASQVHIFYRETMKYWQDASAGEDKNIKILEGIERETGISMTLEEVFDYITSDEKAQQRQWAAEILTNPNASERDKHEARRIVQDNIDEVQISQVVEKANIPDVPTDMQ